MTLPKPSTALRFPCLAIVKHSCIEFLALPSGIPSSPRQHRNKSGLDEQQQLQQGVAPLTVLATVQVNARILNITPFQAGQQQRLAVLTDHADPRLIIVRAVNQRRDGKYEIRSDYQLPLTDLVRPPAEMGLGAWTVSKKDNASASIIAHTNTGTLKITPASSDSSILARSYDVKLPHPTLISLAPIDSPTTTPAVALLSISSIPSKLPGLGTQCVPVLSFHEIDDTNRTLQPIPWGPNRKPPATPTPKNKEQPASASTSTAANGRGKGPQAMGKSITPEQARAKEAELAKSALAQAHVPIPFADALGAHLITSLPAQVGGGILVWGETSILIVPSPSQLYSSVSAPVSPTLSAKAKGKRRKASDHKSPSEERQQVQQAASALSTSPDSAILARSPSSSANEHGKRRRSSVKQQPGMSPTKGAPHSQQTPDDVEGNNEQSPQKVKILRISLPRPVQIVATAVVRDGKSSGIVQDGDDTNRATLNVLFATTAGWLHNLKITLSRSQSTKAWYPSSMHATKIGRIPRPSGPESLTYLGEGFLHVASASGDSVLVQLADDPAGAATATLPSDDVEMVSPPTSPIAISPPRLRGISSSSRLQTQILHQSEPLPDFPLSRSLSLQTVHSWPNLAPALDFLVDGDVNGPTAGAQARVVVACGTGTDGALATVRNGVAVQELGGLQLHGAKRVWNVTLRGGNAGLVYTLGDGSTRILRFSDEGVADVTADIPGRALNRTVECGTLSNGAWVHVAEDLISVFTPGGKILVWAPNQSSDDKNKNATITAASIHDDKILVGVTPDDVILLECKRGDSQLNVVNSIQMEHEVSALDLNRDVAAVGQWSSNTVRLLRIPSLVDVTPSQMTEDANGLGALPRSILIHNFDDVQDSNGNSGDNGTTPYLIAGLSNGSVVSFALSLPTADSLSQTIGVMDKKTSTLGHHPVRLAPFQTTLGKNAVLAVNGDAPTVLWAQEGRMTYSALGYPSVTSATRLIMPGGSSDPVLALVQSGQIELVAAGEIGKLDIQKIALGLDNPHALTGVGKDSFGHFNYFVVLTSGFKPEGNATRDDRRSKVVVYESKEMRKIAEVQLDRLERANCVSTVVLEGQEYLVVGTGYIKPEESQVVSGRLLGFTLEAFDGKRNEWDDRELDLAFETQVDGNTYAVAGVSNKLVAAINSDVLSFGLREGRPVSSSIIGNTNGKPRLVLYRKGRWGSAYMATTLSLIEAEPDRVVVGDALRSMSVLRVESESGYLTEMARDCDPFWNSACSSLDSANQLYIGADISFNLYTTQRGILSKETRQRMEQAEERRRERAAQGDDDARAALSSSNRPPNVEDLDGNWSYVMERRGAWHYGDLVNQFRQGSLVSRATLEALKDVDDDDDDDKMQEDDDGSPSTVSKPLPIDPQLLFCTASGAIGIISQLDLKSSDLLTRVSHNLQVLLSHKYVGKIPFTSWRSLKTDHRTNEPSGFLDGDLLLRYAKELDTYEKEMILNGESNHNGWSQDDDEQQLESMNVIGHEHRSRVEELIDALSRVS
ncbi:unnamed protein product [Sympodiomycopsis kandeliae]